MVRRARPRSRAGQRGAALLIALLIMTLVATLSAGMVWMQWRGIQVESAERARTQAQWLLNASLDWGNLILRSQGKQGGQQEDDLGQPWATPLAETKLSSFLSADGNHADEGGPEAYLSGQITDASSKYNVWNILLDTGKNGDEVKRLANLCTAVGVPVAVATTIASGLRESWDAQQAGGQASPTTVLMPGRVEDLAWYGIDPKALAQLKPFIQILPTPVGATAIITPVNANTAPAEVLLAAIPGLTQAQAQQLILARQRNPFKAQRDIALALGNGAGKLPDPPKDGPSTDVVDVKSSYFEIYGQLRYEQHVIRERSVVYRANTFTPVQVLRRERIAPDPA